MHFTESQNRYSYVWASPLSLREYSGNLAIHEFRAALSEAMTLISRQIESLTWTINFKATLFTGGSAMAVVSTGVTCATAGGLGCGMAINGLALVNAQLRLVAMEIADLQRQVMVWAQVESLLGSALSSGNRGDWSGAERELQEAKSLLRTLGGNPPKGQVEFLVDSALRIAEEMQGGSGSRNPNTVERRRSADNPAAGLGGKGGEVVDWSRAPSACYACQAIAMK